MRLSKFTVMTEHSTESQQVTEHAKGRYVHILCLLVISFLAATCIHTTARMILLETNLADFAHYYFFSDLLSEGVDIYSLLPDELAQMKTSSTLPVYIAGKPEYSPAFFVAFIPLSHLPFWTAFTVWICANSFALLACVVLLARYIHGTGTSRMVSYALASVLSLASQPLFECLGIGQINIFILLLLLLIHTFMNRKPHEIVAGACLGLILLTKPQFGVLFVLFLLWRNFRLCGYTLLVYVVLQGMAASLCGYAIELSYWSNLLHSVLSGSVGNVGLNTFNFNLSLNALFARTLHGSPLQLMATPAYIATSTALLIATYVRAAGRTSGASSAGFCLCLCLAFLVSPLTEEHHLLILALPFAATIVKHSQGRLSVALIITAFLLVNVRYSLTRFPMFDSGPLAVFAFGKTFGVGLLWYELLRRLKPSQISANGALKI